MRTRWTLVGMVLGIGWALVVALATGPRASIAEVTAWWLAGVVLVGAAWLGVGWLQASAAQADLFADAPGERRGQWAVELVLLAIAVPVLMVLDAVRESAVGQRLAYWRQRFSERLHRSTPLHGDALRDRAKGLEGTAPRIRS